MSVAGHGRIRATIDTLAEGDETMRLLLAVLLACVAFIPSVLAWDEPTSFHGIPFGASPEVIRQHLPRFRCRREGGPTYATHHCDGHLMIGTVHAFALIECETAGMDSVALSFAVEKYDEMTSAFLARYGTPTDRETEPLQNRLGAHFLNEILRWTGKVLSIRLEKYGADVTQSMAFLRTHEATALREQRRKEKGAAGKKDL